MNSNLTALATSLALSLSLNAIVLAQSAPTNGQRPNLPTPNDNRQRSGESPASILSRSTFEGLSRSFDFQEALSDALDKARQSLSTQRDGTINFRVLEIRGVAAGQGSVKCCQSFLVSS